MNSSQLLDEVEYDPKSKSEIKEGRGLHNFPYHSKAESNNCFITHSMNKKIIIIIITITIITIMVGNNDLQKVKNTYILLQEDLELEF